MRMRLVGLVVTVSLLLATVAQAANPPSWQWRSEMPRWNQLKAVAYGDGRFVAVGDAGTVLTSTNGAKWTAGQTDLPTASLTAVTYGDGLWVALGEADAWLPDAMKRVGLLLTSKDGLRWTEAQRLEDVVLQHVAHGDGRFLVTGYAAVGGSSQRVLYTSTDGAQWARHESQRSFGGIAYGGGLFIGITENELIGSTDGLTWESRFTIPSGHDVAEVIHTGSQFVAVGSQGEGGAYIATSADGRAWQPQTAAGVDRLYQVAARGNSVVALGSAHLYRSADVITWKAEAERSQLHMGDVTCSPVACVSITGTEILTEATDGAWRSNYDGSSGHLSSIADGNGQFLAISGDRFLRSADGLTWADAEGILGQGDPWEGHVRPLDVTYGNGWYIAQGLLNLEKILYRSKDGKRWEQVYQSYHPSGAVPLRYVGGHFFFLDQTSVDGERWEKVATPTFYAVDLIYGQGRYLALDSVGRVYQSTEGGTWEQVETGLPQGPVELRKALVYGRGRFVMVREDLQKLLVSTDGATWTEHPWPFARQAPRIAYYGGIFLATADDGFWTSTDGITWSTAPGTPNAAGSGHLAFGRGQVVAAGLGGVVFTGQLCGTAFNDLPAEHPACTPVELLANRQVIGGFPDGSFRPEAPVTRAELTKLMAVLLDQKPAPTERLAFRDAADHWAAKQGYIQTMVALGAVNGFPDGSFRPEAPVTRAQLIKIVATLAGLKSEGTVPYADVTEDHWYHDQVATATASRLMGWGAPYPIWTDEALQADAPVTRAEAATVLANLMER